LFCVTHAIFDYVDGGRNGYRTLFALPNNVLVLLAKTVLLNSAYPF